MSDIALSAETIVARVERLPISRWHNYMRVVVGSATFFDAFDALVIAFVLPVLIPLWQMSPAQVGLLVSSGYVGQVIGCILFGWVAERFGRLRSLAWTIGVISVLSIACAFAWDANSLMVLRFIQGIGLGGEVPIALAYVNEFAKAEKRGRFVLIFQSIFPVGILVASLVSIWVVPHWGWQWMFIIGAVPALLAATLRRVLPESPRWLATKGRLAEADRVVSELEAKISEDGKKPLPPLVHVPRILVEKEASWRDLFADIYLRRTVVIWICWFVASFVGFGITIWLPTILRTVYKLPLQEALQYGFIGNIAAVAGVLTITFLVDHTGRRCLRLRLHPVASLVGDGRAGFGHHHCGPDLDCILLHFHAPARPRALCLRALSHAHAGSRQRDWLGVDTCRLDGGPADRRIGAAERRRRRRVFAVGHGCAGRRSDHGAVRRGNARRRA
jgi:MFS transporter, putative metabolite:H+ symporter